MTRTKRRLECSIGPSKMQAAHPARPPGRSGLALVAALITLVILALLMSAVAWQILAGRRVLKHRAYELQAEWLARAGAEYAAALLLTSPKSYAQQAIQLIDQSSVVIQVEAAPESPDVFLVASRAIYPLDVRAPVTRSILWKVRLVMDGGLLRLEGIQGEPESLENSGSP